MYAGFSTGSISLGDFKQALAVLALTDANAVELSALRENELFGLLTSLDQLPLEKYTYISFHAPSKLVKMNESQLVDALLPIAERHWNIVVHPDIITDFAPWRTLGSYLCVENMDKRKPAGRTAADMELIFAQLPEASFCLDLAHARQVDPSMTECFLLLKKFGDRLQQFHVSDLTSESKHSRLTLESMATYQRALESFHKEVVVILESPILASPSQQQDVIQELIKARSIFQAEPVWK